MSQKSPQKKKKQKKKREREKMYLMYYLNEDGKRVYTLKVRRDYYYRAFVCLFLSFFRRSLGETRGVVCCDLSLARALLDPKKIVLLAFFLVSNSLI